MLRAVGGAERDLTLWQDCARAAPIFAYGLGLDQLSGRRTFGTWSALDVIVSIMLGSSLSRALTGSASLRQHRCTWGPVHEAGAPPAASRAIGR